MSGRRHATAIRHFFVWKKPSGSYLSKTTELQVEKMMLAIRPLNRVILSAFAAMAFFGVLVAAFPINTLIIILNGVFAGSMAALAVAYWRLLWNAVIGVRPYDRVQQMTIGFTLCWLAYSVSVTVSVVLQASGYPADVAYLVAASRYIAVVAAVLQVSAPDFGLGLFHGRDRKVLVTSVAIGLVVAAVVVYVQDHAALQSEECALAVETGSPCTYGAEVGPPIP